MPCMGRAYPYEVHLAHDIVSYFRDHQKREPSVALPLTSYPPVRMSVEDPLSLSETGSYRQDWSLTDVWQLASPLPGAGRSTLRRFIQESSVRAE